MTDVRSRPVPAAGSARHPARPRVQLTRIGRAVRRSGVIMLAPAVLGIILLVLVPLIRIISQSVTEHVDAAGTVVSYSSLSNYRILFTDGYSLHVLLRTLVVCVSISVITAIVGYPYAYTMTIVGRRTRIIMITLVLVPLWTSVLARSFAWVVLLQQNGPVDKVFGVALKGSVAAVTVAMAQVLLPFVVLPMYAVMQGIDRRLLAAAESLGATSRSAFWRIYFPLSLAGVKTGMTLAFVLSLGFYLTASLLGSPQDAVVAQLLVLRTQTLDFGGAGALGVLILATTLLVLGLAGGLSRTSRSARRPGAGLRRQAEVFTGMEEHS